MRILLLIMSVCFFFFRGIPEEEFPFTETEYNFGTINESGGPVSHVFWFVNTTKITKALYQARTSCGCTIATIENRYIEPGDTARVTVTYNPEHNAKDFEREIFIIKYPSDTISTLRISGYVKSPL